MGLSTTAGRVDDMTSGKTTILKPSCDFEQQHMYTPVD